jgi:hydrogenase maturation protease
MTAQAPTALDGDRFAGAGAIAEAVLYEGYVLYPYRASAPKNQLRWQFGVLAPHAYADITPNERASCRTECIVDPGDAPRLRVRVRCLQVQRRTVETATPDGGFTAVDALDVDGTRVLPWDEVVEHELDVAELCVLPLPGAPHVVDFDLPAVTAIEELGAPGGGALARIRHRAEPASARVSVAVTWADGFDAFLKVTGDIENTTAWPAHLIAPDVASRDDAVRSSLVAVHTLLGIDDGRFVSLLDPDAAAEIAVAGCKSVGTYPVLVDANDTVVLSSPIILYDHPVVAPESDGPLYDATEIDEILALRVLTLTDEEKAEARATDRRAAAVVDRIDGMDEDVWARLHGTMREFQRVDAEPVHEAAPTPWWEPAADAEVDPWTESVMVAGVEVRAGSGVRLHPTRRADAHDMFFDGMTATVAGVFRDAEDEMHVAVTVDDDPATEALLAHGRYLFFHPDEVEPLGTVRPALRRVLVAGIGNIFLGDDGFGVAVAQRLEVLGLPVGARAEDFGIRSLHLAYELLEGYDLLVLIDAVPMGEPPGTVKLLAPGRTDRDGEPVMPAVEGHSLSPAGVLATLAGLGGAIEEVIIVGCEPAQLDEGIGLSGVVAAAVEPAAQAVTRLLAERAESDTRKEHVPKERETTA